MLCEGIPLQDKSFLDIGFGQGLALYYGGERGALVTGIDPDSDNLLAAKEVENHFPGISQPILLQRSILDPAFVQQCQQSFDVVYSWGALRHTGDL